MGPIRGVGAGVVGVPVDIYGGAPIPEFFIFFKIVKLTKGRIEQQKILPFPWIRKC